MINFGVPVNFKRDALFFLMIIGTNNLSKTSFAKNTPNFESIQYVVTWLDYQVAISIINRLGVSFERAKVNVII